jgi:hypothetical protein
MRDGRLVSKAKLKGGQIQDRVQENLIGDITCSVDSIGPKASRSLMHIKYHPYHLNKSAVLSFQNFILLRHMRGRNLLINTMLKAKLIKRGIPELGPIIIANSFQAVGMLIVQPQSQALKVFKHFILAFKQLGCSTMTRTYHLPPMEQTREGPTLSIRSNCPGCSDIIVLTREWDAAIILP